MADFEQLWGPILQARGAGQALDQLDRTRRLEARVDPIGAARPGYLNPLPEAEGALKQGARSVAAIDVDFTPKIDELPPDRQKPGSGGVLPPGSTVNDLLRWNGSAWVVLAAPSTSSTWVLAVESGTMKWIEGDEC